MDKNHTYFYKVFPKKQWIMDNLLLQWMDDKTFTVDNGRP